MITIKNNIQNCKKRVTIKMMQLVKGRPFLGCIFKILLRGRSRDFQEYVSRYRPPVKNGNHKYFTRHLVVDTYGKLNPHKIIMLLECDSGSGGFCAQWVYFLNRLSFSDSMGFSHSINWYGSQFYKEKSLVYNKNNIFEYFFDQPSNISVKEAKESQNVILDNNTVDYGYYDAFAVGREDDYAFSAEDIKRFAIIQKKYIRLNECLKQEISDGIVKMFKGRKVLAIHARGADAQIPYNKHPIPVTIDEYISKTKELAAEIKADAIFLATDDNNILKIFINEFGEKLLYYKGVERSDGIRMNCYGESERPLHHYNLGKEIIRDVYTMASCQGFVCSLSYVSYIVQVVKKSMEEDFEAIYCIKKSLRKDGMNLNDPQTVKTVETLWNKEINKK